MTNKKSLSIKDLKNIYEFISGTNYAINLLATLFAVAVPVAVFVENGVTGFGLIMVFLFEIILLTFVFSLKRIFKKEIKRLEEENKK